MGKRATALLGLVAVAAAPAVASASHKSACEKHRKHLSAKSAQVLVWHKTVNTPLGPYGTGYYACLRPHGKSIKVGVTWPSGEYVADMTLNALTAAGTFVAGEGSQGAGSQEMCFKYNPQGPCPSPTYYLRVLDVKTKARVDITADGAGSAAPFALSPKSAVAWLTSATLWATGLHRSGKTFSTSPVQLDAGDIDPKSLKFSGNTLSWTHSGTPHQQVIQ